MEIINKVTVKERSKVTEFFKGLKSKTENVFFSIIEWLPERITPLFLMKWVDRYIDKRMKELEREQIKVNWDKTYLEQAVKELRNK